MTNPETYLLTHDVGMPGNKIGHGLNGFHGSHRSDLKI